MKKFPLNFKFSGNLHEVVLVNFSVDSQELTPFDIQGVTPQLFDGRAMVSMVDVQLRGMRMQHFPLISFSYRHLGLRLLVQDKNLTEDAVNHGLYFLRSYTDRTWVAAAGNLAGPYRLHKADFEPLPAGLISKGSDGGKIHYNLDWPIQSLDEKLSRLKGDLQQRDRAYYVNEKAGFLESIRIMRDRWPLEAKHCNRFSVSCFPSARLEGVFTVPQTIPYQWLQPARVAQLDAKQSAGRLVNISQPELS